MAAPVINIGDSVRIDDRGTGVVTAVIDFGKGEPEYFVQIEGTEYEARMKGDRLKTVPTKVFDKSIAKQTINRFRQVSETDIDEVITRNENKNTAKKTLYNVRLLESYLAEQNETRKIYELSVSELSHLLSKFLISVTKKDGSSYEPSTLRSYISSVDRYLKKHEYGYSIAFSAEFAKVRDVLKSRQIELKKSGKGNLPNKSEPISDEEINILWESKQLGSENPQAVINSLWFFNTVHFGLRGSDEHRQMCWGDISLNTDANGVDFLTFNEKQSKTRSGENPRDVRQVRPNMWANLEDPSRCPIAIYKMYRSKRPLDYCANVGPFYIASNTMTNSVDYSGNVTWFRRQPIGENKLRSLMKDMCTAANLQSSKRLTNHSARKFLVQKLSDNAVPPTEIMQITGHKNLQSINNYSNINEARHREISSLLSNPVQQNTQLSRAFPVMNGPRYSCTATRSSNEMNVSVSGGINTLFAAPVYGGNITINVQKNEQVAPPRKYRRLALIESDSSQETD